MSRGLLRLPEAAPDDRAATDDPCVDFCLWPYAPLAPQAGRLRSSAILTRSFQLAAVAAEGAVLRRTIEAAFGRFHTVWGLKLVEGRPSWEFYFYDYARLGRTRSLGRLLDALRPTHPASFAAPETRPYFMVSIAMTPETIGGGPLDEADVYVGNPGSAVSSGVCYRLTAEGLELKNFYFFFGATSERDAALGKLFSSAYIDAGSYYPSAFVWPEVASCQTLVVANKRHGDALYFSRIDVGALLFFMKRVGYAPALIEYVSENKHDFSHLYFDAGYDFRIDGDGMTIAKAGIYGYF